jgi:hypothetical protein
VNKVRKFGQWLWNNKERMVFAIMVAVLAWRVYQVVNPAPPENAPTYAVPRSGAVDVPYPPDRPRPEVAPPLRPLTRANPFWYHANPAGSGADGEDEGPDMVLDSIQMTPRGPIAMIKVSGDRARKFEKGDKASTFEVLEIDPEGGVVIVYDESQGKQFELTKP